MRHLVACQDEDRAAERAAADATARRLIRELVDKWDAEAGGGGDNAA